jgi:predicted permease
LALGIGANAAIFSLINALTLKPLPIPDARSLVSIETTGSATIDGKDRLSFAMFEALQREQKVFSSMFLWNGGGVINIEANGATYAGSAEPVGGDYFLTLGIQPALGRLLTKDDTGVAVLDYRCWQARYQGDPGVLGKTIRINGAPHTIVGVTPESFHGMQIDIAPDAIVPIDFAGRQFRNPENTWFQVFGRLRPGVTIEQARAQIETLWPGVRLSALPPSYQGEQRAEFLKRRILIDSAATGNSFLRLRMTRPLTLLMALVVLVLFIACMNLANLMLARAAARRQEIGIRAALGSGLWRIARQLVIEGLVLSTTGAVCGLAMAMWASRTLANAVWHGLVPLAIDTNPDTRVLLFTTLIAIATGVAFGLAPMWNVSRMEALRQHNRSVRGGTGRFGQILVSAQIAVSLVLLVGATLFSKSLGNLYGQNPGFRRDGVLLVQLYKNPGVKKIPNPSAYFRNLADQLAQIPGVQSVSYSHMGPVTIYEYKEPVGNNAVQAIFELVGPGFFDVLDMHVLAGRQFSWQDDENSKRVVVVSQSLAEKLFPNRSAVGQRIKIGSDPEHQDIEIVGVVSNASLWMVQSHEPPAFFLPLMQEGIDQPTVNVRVHGDPMRVGPSARNVVKVLGKHYALSIETINQRMDRMLSSERLIAVLSGFFGALAVLLAVIGLYGVMTLAVTARTSEIGVRMALGAQRGDVIGMILRQVLITTAVGLAVGVPVTLATSKYVQSMVFGLPARDPATLALAASVLVAAALVAGYLPARYASRIDPMSALRSE